LNTKRDAHKTFDTGYSAWARSVLFFIFFKKSHTFRIYRCLRKIQLLYLLRVNHGVQSGFLKTWLMVPFSLKRMSFKSHCVSTKKKLISERSNSLAYAREYTEKN